MATRSADPFTGTDWLLLDGNNLLHALSSSTTAPPRAALIGRLRGAVPASVAIDVVFDGPAERGLGGERIAPGLRIRYGGRRSADAVLLSMVEEVRHADGPVGTAAILVVTDDMDLRRRLHGKGARTAGTRWLLGRLERAGGRPPGTAPARVGMKAGPNVGAGSGSEPRDGDDEGADEPRWSPGRGATVKKGNPRRRPRGGARGGDRC